MNSITYQFEVDVIDEARQRISQKMLSIDFNTSAYNMPLSRFSELETYMQNLDLWAKVALGTKDIAKIDPLDITDDLYIANWDSARYGEYAAILLHLLGIFAMEDSAENLEYLAGVEYECWQDIKALQELFVQVYTAFNNSHTPKEIEYFTHKGRRFVVPYDAELIGRALTWGEATEALQADYMSAKTKDGEGKYPEGVLLNTSLAVIASVCREVKIRKNGTFTQVPLPKGGAAWQAHLAAKMEFFKDLPCAAARDVGFFLINSFTQCEVTVSLALLLSAPQYKEIARASLSLQR